MEDNNTNLTVKFEYNNDIHSIDMFFSFENAQTFLDKCEINKEYKNNFKQIVYDMYKDTKSNNNFIEFEEFKLLDETLFSNWLKAIVENDKNLEDIYIKIDEENQYKKLYIALNTLINNVNTKFVELFKQSQEYLNIQSSIANMSNMASIISGYMQANKSILLSAVESTRSIVKDSLPAIKIVSEAGIQAVRYIQEILPPYIEVLQSNLKSILDNIKFPSEEYINELYKKLSRVASKCGKLQWTLPANIDMNILYHMYGTKYSKTRVDATFMKFFISNKERELNNIIKNIGNSKYTKEYRKLFNQSIYNYKRKKYFSSLIVIITIYEGIIATVSENKNNIQVQAVINNIHSKISKEEDNFILADINSLKKFNDELYCSVEFSNIPKTRKFNRHVIMHGRCIESIGKIETVKMLNALDTLIYILDYMEETNII